MEKQRADAFRVGHGRRGLVPVVLLVLSLLLGACAGSATDDTSGAGPQEEGEAEPVVDAEDSPTEVKRQPDEMTDARIQIGWYAQPEQGGLWLAEQEGLFKERNVNADALEGGPGLDKVRLVATGKADFTILNGDELALARNQGIPIVMVASRMQKSPHVVMVHEESGITSLEDIAAQNAHVYTASTSAPVFQYLMQTFGWTEDQLLGYRGQLSDWLINKDRAVMAYMTREPFIAEKEGANVRVFDVADLVGFNTYNGLATTEKTIREKPELVHAVVEAWLEGWHRYIEDPDATIAYIKTLNPDMEDATMRYSYETVVNEMILTGDALNEGIGVMTKERWNTLYDQLKEIGMIDEALDPDDAWTDEFFQDVIRPYEE